ncbi:MAG: PIN domain nuclease [Gammaproteobacteria bacterium]|nr:PIN domain nuclease [Gammaproteobacteria bacterium]MCP5444961.1 PIN domain nuclease [Chromatiaceae bacterium]
MIVVDTSVWIDYFNGKESDETNILDSSLGKQEVAVGDLIVLEILRGFRSDKDYNTAKKYLANLHQFNMLSPELALKASEYYRKLRKRGVTIRKTADIIIATFCIEKKLPLLYADKDFIPFSEHLKLRTVSPKT